MKHVLTEKYKGYYLESCRLGKAGAYVGVARKLNDDGSTNKADEPLVSGPWRGKDAMRHALDGIRRQVWHKLNPNTILKKLN